MAKLLKKASRISMENIYGFFLVRTSKLLCIYYGENLQLFCREVLTVLYEEDEEGRSLDSMEKIISGVLWKRIPGLQVLNKIDLKVFHCRIPPDLLWRRPLVFYGEGL